MICRWGRALGASFPPPIPLSIGGVVSAENGSPLASKGVISTDDSSHPLSLLRIKGVVPADSGFMPASRGGVPGDIDFPLTASGQVRVVPSALLPIEPPPVSSLPK